MNFWEMRRGPERDAARNAYFYGTDQRWLSVFLQRHGLPFPPGLTATCDRDRLTLRYGNRTETINIKNVCALVLRAYINSLCSPAPAIAEPTNQGADEIDNDRTVEGI